jgi:hypothetical protein
VQVFSFKILRESFGGGMATKTENRIIVNLTPVLAAQVKLHASNENRSNSNFVKGLIKAWAMTVPALEYPELTDEEPKKFLAAEESTPLPPATLAQAVAAKARAAAARREMTHAATPPTPRPRSQQGKSLPVQPKG